MTQKAGALLCYKSKDPGRLFVHLILSVGLTNVANIRYPLDNRFIRFACLERQTFAFGMAQRSIHIFPTPKPFFCMGSCGSFNVGYSALYYCRGQ